ncbi:EVE domain-containing protein [Curvivirga aplysinae]|uniref:EVE domain-containing protein n=1 Tax=Curvivirga aplysinae TaxID=2529852 RepID=UPI0012BD05FF|nr:EVE domain-containing protein [Curvivirga aplysinae]MTI09457.1 EVE domain-containing protein [Curvivirga aplysinae]
MKYWLMKSEPETWSWEQQVETGEEGEGWDGVRNHQASNFMKEMKLGDQVFFYHSGKTREIVGIVEVCKEYHPDPTDITGRFGMVSVKALKTVQMPVSLKMIKSDPRLSELALIKQSRLSVMPIPEDAWHIILGMAK